MDEVEVFLMFGMCFSIVFILFSSGWANNTNWRCVEWQNVTEVGQLCSYQCHYQALSNDTAECSTFCSPVNISVPHCVVEMLVRNVSS